MRKTIKGWNKTELNLKLWNLMNGKRTPIHSVGRACEIPWIYRWTSLIFLLRNSQSDWIIEINPSNASSLFEWISVRANIKAIILLKIITSYQLKQKATQPI